MFRFLVDYLGAVVRSSIAIEAGLVPSTCFSYVEGNSSLSDTQRVRSTCCAIPMCVSTPTAVLRVLHSAPAHIPVAESTLAWVGGAQSFLACGRVRRRGPTF